MDPEMMAPTPKPRLSLQTAPSLDGLVDASGLAEKSTLVDAGGGKAQQMRGGEQQAAGDRAPYPMTNKATRKTGGAGNKGNNRFIKVEQSKKESSNKTGVGTGLEVPQLILWKLGAPRTGAPSLEDDWTSQPALLGELGTAAGRVLPDHCGEFDHPPLGAPARGDPARGIGVDKRGIQMYKTSPGKGKTPNKIPFSIFRFCHCTISNSSFRNFH